MSTENSKKRPRNGDSDPVRVASLFTARNMSFTDLFDVGMIPLPFKRPLIRKSRRLCHSVQPQVATKR